MGTIRFRVLVAFAVVVASLGGVAQASAANDGDKISAIKAYEGTWSIKIDNLETAHSKAGHEESTLRNDCWRSGGFYACNQYVNGESEALIVFTYDEAKERFTSYPIPVGGGPADAGVLEIKGNVWTFPWTQTEDGKTVQYRVVNVFETAEKITYRREFSEDGTKWTVMATGHEVKVN